jgi:hypothetical protein
LTIIERTLGLIAAALFMLAPIAAWAQESTAPSRAITGRVITSTGEPANGAIYASQVGALPSGLSPAPIDSAGNFKVDNLEAGQYRIWAALPGFVSADQPAIPGEPQYYRPGDSVTLNMIKGGVITGRVTGPNGPLVAANVRAIRVRDAGGKALPLPLVVRERKTDDRGVYRIYGLALGTYLVAAGGPPRFGWGISPTAFGSDVPTYFPSSTRDNASEIIVRSGEDSTADINFRAEPGRAISGAVTGAPESETQFSGVNVSLTDVRDRLTILSLNANAVTNYSFVFYGVPDGEYELVASQVSAGINHLRSEPRRIHVRGADVGSLKLALVLQARIEGQLVVELDAKAGCGKRRENVTQEMLIRARPYAPETKPGIDAKSTSDLPIVQRNVIAEAAPDVKGSFMLRNLTAGNYRIDARMAASGWYLRAIAAGPLLSAAARNASLALARDGVTLKTGERLSGLTITITEGAASVRGRVVVPEGQQLPSGVRIYFAPAEKENAGDVLRFFETQAEPDGTFAIGNIAPGKFWLIARQVEASDSNVPKAIRRDSAFRSTVLREAEGAKNALVLQPCERKLDYELPFQSPKEPPK